MAKQSVIIRLNQLLNKTINIITSSSAAYGSFLTGIAPTYKYNFAEQLMIYAQNPTPIAVAPMQTWNRIGFWVNKNAPRIDVFLKGQLYTLYNIADVSSKEGKRPYIWSLHEEYIPEVLKNLSERYNIRVDGESFSEAVPSVIEAAMQEHELDNLPYSDLLMESCHKIICTRCGYQVLSTKPLFDDITVFSNNIMAIGAEINSISRDILDNIERTVRTLDIERMTEGGQNHVIRRNQSELSRRSERQHDTRGRVSESNELGQVREPETELPVRTQSADVRANASGRDSGTAPQGDRRGSDSESVKPDEANATARESERGSQELGSIQVDGNDEQLQSRRRRDRPERTDIHLTDKQNKKKDRAVDIPSAALPFIEQLVYCGDVSRHQYEHKFAIYDYFLEHEKQNDRIDYLVSQYNSFGQGNTSFEIRCGKKSKGVTLTISNENPEKYNVSYGQIASLIDERIADGSYLPSELSEQYNDYRFNMERRSQRNKLVSEIRNIIELYNSHMDQQKRFSDSLNLYFLTDCTSMYIAGNKRSTVLHSNGDLVLPALEKALETVIRNDNKLSDRAIATLAVLKSDLSQEVLPTQEEMAFQKALDNKDYKLQNGDIIYINRKKMKVADIQDDQVTFYDEETPLILSQMDQTLLNEALTDDRRNLQYLDVEKYYQEEPLPLSDNQSEKANENVPDIEVGSGFTDNETPAVRKLLENADSLDEVDSNEIRKKLEKSGIVNGELVDPDKLNEDPFIQQVMSDAESVSEKPAFEPTQNDILWDNYESVKYTHTDGILLIRVGDFYESFSDEARQLSDQLELTLTRRTIHDEEGNITSVPMVGIPAYKLEEYVQKLTDSNNKVYVLENIKEEPKTFLPSSITQTEDNKSNPQRTIATITCLWSENPAFEEGKEYSVFEFDELMYRLDTERHRGWKALLARHHNNDMEAREQEEDMYYRYIGYDKTGFTINLPDGTTIEERQDIGDGFGGVVDYIESNTAYVNVFPQLIEAIRSTNPEALEEDVIIRVDKPTNFRLSNSDVGVGTPKERYAANIKAIKTLKQIEKENRYATEEEKVILSNYVGWGGLSEVFDEYNYGWQNEYKELHSLLSDSEYEAARSSVNTAFFTPPVVIDAIYQVLESNGFKGGKILEPSCGVGNFFGRLPVSMESSELHGVEIDSISGRIAKALYPNADIQIKGFEKTDFNNDFFDVVIGNVPFGDFKVYDPDYKTQNFLIHDYFFAKALDKVRPNGIVALITSQGTMDKQLSTVRKYLAQRAELVGAIRLPRGVFKSAAGTDVTSDIVILQKREKALEAEPSWVHLDKDINNKISINSYFVDHPRMICGEMQYVSERYRPVPRCILGEKQDFNQLLDRAVNYIRFEYDNGQPEIISVNPDSVNSIPADPLVQDYSFTVSDDKLYYRIGKVMNRVDLNQKQTAQIKKLIELRETVRKLLDMQVADESDQVISDQMRLLNQIYDDYQNDYGYINSKTAEKLFSADSSYYLLATLEIWNDNKFVRKGDIFTKRTVRPHVDITSVDTSSEALSLSLGEKARVDIEYMSDLTGKTEEEIYEDLRGVIFLNPLYNPEEKGSKKYLTSEEYLSDDVREKLSTAKRYAKLYPDLYSFNVEALEKIQPVDLKATEIEARLGSTWIPADDIQAFMYDLLKTPFTCQGKVKVSFTEYTSEWYVSNKSYDRGVSATNIYGTSRISAYALLENSLNLRDTKIYDYHDVDGKRTATINQEETQKAQNKQKAIENAFSKWIWQEPNRRKRLTALYNKKFNSIRPREYDGSYLKFEGSNPEITLRKHQVDAIARIIHGGNTLLAHVMGAGKTFEMVAAAQEMKRLGLCTKSMIVVPNHIVEQFATEYYQLYPNANILVTTKRDFETANRKKFCARIATGDYDAVIIGHSQFEKIPMSVQAQEEVLNEQLYDIRAAIDASEERYSIKQLEAQKKRVIEKLERLRDQSNKDDVVTFEQLGVDRLFVDEAHSYKNLAVLTKMGNVAGISTSEAKKSADLYLKIRYLDQKTQGKGVIFATGTPVSNSMVEMYTNMRYLYYDGLREKGLINFDAWASTFGDVVTSIELSPDGSGYRAKKRFAKFHNIPELRNMFSQFADVKTADMLNLNVPEAVYENIVLQPSEDQLNIVKTFGQRANAIRDRKVDPSEDNMLKITNDGRKLALDQRLFDPTLPDFEGSKPDVCAKKVYEIWKDTQEQKLTQLIFCDLSTPKPNHEFNVYDDLKEKLTSLGIPDSDIAYIHSANTEKAKQALFKKVRSGDVRILIGSTQKMGAGTNVQDKLIALHHLDCPWRPSDLQQQEGRIIRQGNQNKKVYIFTYLTESTFDAYLYQIIVNKQKFISQIMTSKTPVRVAEDIDETVLNYSEIMALASGDQRIKEKIELDKEVNNLKLMESDYNEQRFLLQDKLTVDLPIQLSYYQQLVSDIKEDVKYLSHLSDDQEYPITVAGTVYTDKGKGEQKLFSAMKENRSNGEIIGEYKGFKLYMEFNNLSFAYDLVVKRAAKYRVKKVNLKESHILVRLNNAIKSIPSKLEEAQGHLDNVKTQIKSAEEELAKPFAHADELAEKQARLDEINAALDLDNPKSAQQKERNVL